MEALGNVTRDVKVSTTSKDMGWSKQEINVTFDFTGCTMEEVIDWAVADRKIAFQRPARELGLGEYMKLEGTTVHVRDVGKKVESEEARKVKELARKLMAKGYSMQELEELVGEM